MNLSLLDRVRKTTYAPGTFSPGGVGMPARKPEECNLLLAEALHRGDVDAGVALYEPSASLVLYGSGQVVIGRAAIRDVLQRFVDLKLKIAMDITAVQNGDGDLALTRTNTTATGVDADGQPVSMSGRTVELVRRQPDGTWLFVIDDQHGTN
jgi:uncharacterized protein (TIGR02246 family)